MKRNLAILFAILLPLALQARPLDTSARALKVSKELAPQMMRIPGVNGIGVTGCNPITGRKDVRGPFVHCVLITTDNEKTFRMLNRVYPHGTQFDGVFVTIENIGVVRPQ